jgi:YVTN family beta-propeller protein
MKQLITLALLAFVTTASVVAASAIDTASIDAGLGKTGQPFKVVADIALPGNPTRLDYQSIDPSRQLLFIAHLGDSTVIAVDLRRRQVIATIPELSEVHGVLVVPEKNLVFASATGTNEVAVIDERTLKVVARIPAGAYPDGMALDPRSDRLFVSDERGRTETVIDTHRNRRVATIALGGEAGNTQYDSGSGHIFVNVQTSGSLIEIDPRSNAIVRRIPVSSTGCAGNHGLAIDARDRLAFVACEDSATLISVSLSNQKIEHTWIVGDGPDVVAFDAGNEKLAVASESGTVSIFSWHHGFARIAQGFFAPRAHAVAVDPRTHLWYLPLENVAGSPRLRIVEIA